MRYHLSGSMVAGLFALSLAPALAQSSGTDAAAGETLFKQRCAMCHAVEAGKNKVGPSLAGIVGRTAGSTESYHYSDANKNSGLTWDKATLDKYLTDPQAVIKGTKMIFAGIKKDDERANVIAYLATLK